MRGAVGMLATGKTAPETRKAAIVVDTDRWIRRYFPSPNPAIQLICMPHAGGSASFFHPVARALGPEIDVRAVQYPGRQERRHERFIDDLGALADAVGRAVRPGIDRPFALFGHSMGATLAYEVARRLESAGTVPLRVFVSGRRAPSRHRLETIHKRDDNGLIMELKMLSGTDHRIFGDDELLRMVLPAIRNDYKVAETYVHSPGSRLASPITALAGDRDPKATRDELQAWHEHTDGEFDLQTYHGGHFYLIEHQASVLDVIRRQLLATSAA